MNSTSKEVFKELLYTSVYVIFSEIMITMDPIAIVDGIQTAEEIIDNKTIGSDDVIVVEGVITPADLILPKMLECKEIYLLCVEDEDIPEFLDLNGLFNRDSIIANGRIEKIELEDIKTVSIINDVSKLEAFASVIEDFVSRISWYMEDTYLLLGYQQKLSTCIDPEGIDDSAMEIPTTIGKALKPKTNNKTTDMQYGV